MLMQQPELVSDAEIEDSQYCILQLSQKKIDSTLRHMLQNICVHPGKKQEKVVCLCQKAGYSLVISERIFEHYVKDQKFNRCVVQKMEWYLPHNEGCPQKARQKGIVI